MTSLRIVMEDIPDSHLVAALAADFERENPGLEVTVDAMHYDYMLEQITGSIDRPDAPNGVVIFDNPWTHDWVTQELIRPIDDLLAATPELDWDDFAPALREAAVMDGKTWGVPFYTWSFGLIYRKDLYAEAGLQPPRTLAELAANAKALTTTDRAGMAMQPRADYNAAEEWCNYLFAAGGAVQQRDGAITIDSPQAREALHTYADLYATCAPKGTEEWTFEDSIAALAKGTAAQMINCHWWVPVLNDPAGPAGELAGKFGLAEIPGGVGILGVWFWAITRAADPEQAEAAWRFISWITSKRANDERVSRGGAPVRTSTMGDSGVWQRGFGQEYYETLRAMHDAATPLMSGANAEEATRVIGAAVHDVAAGTRDVETALTQAAAEVARLMGQPQRA